MKTIIQTARSNPYLRGGIALSIASFGVGFINYLTNTLIARGLGSGGYGEFATVISYTSLLAIPLSTISAEIIKKIKQTKQSDQHMWSRVAGWETLILHRITRYYWTILFIPIVVYLLQLVTGLNLASSIFLAIYVVLLIFTTFYTAVAQGTHEFGIFTILSVVGAALKLAGGLVVAFVYKSIEVVLVSFLLSGLPLIHMHRLISHKAQRPTTTTPTAANLRNILLRRQVLITMGALLGFGLIGSIDLMILKHVSDNHTLGLVGGWSLLGKIIMYVFGPLGALALLYFSDTSDSHKSQRQVQFVVAAIIGGSAVAYAAYSIVPNLIIQLILGTTFSQLAPVLFWAAIYGFLLTCTMLFCNFFIAKSSYFALAPLAIVPFQAVALATNHSNLQAVIHIDVASSLAATLCYLIGLLLYTKYPMNHGQ